MSNQIDAPPLNEDELNEIYNWVDTINLSRPKKHIARDFADGVLMAEVVHHYLPKLVELHNYSQAHSIQQKQYNWGTLNQKSLKKMGFQITQNDVDAIINCVPEAVERVLKVVQVKIQLYIEQNKSSPQIEKNNNNLINQSVDNGRGRPQIQNPKQGQKYQGNSIIEGKNNNNNASQEHRNIVIEKEIVIQDQKETIEILELKIQKLEQLVKLKDSKIQTLINKLQQAGIR